MNPRTASPRPLLSLGMAILAPLYLASALRAEVRGAIETFSFQTNANSWNHVDFADPARTLRPPLWNRLPARDNPEIYALFNGSDGFLLAADTVSSFGAFAGNFTAARVSGIACGVFVENFDLFAFADVVLYSTATNTFYYSDNLPVTASGWTTVYTDFRENGWSTRDDESGNYFPAVLTDAILEKIISAGVRFFPNSSAASGQAAGIDAFFLVPDFILPALDLTRVGPDTHLTFDALLGQSYTLRESGTLLNFQPIPGQVGITGQGTYTFVSPLDPNGHYFDLESELKPIEIPEMTAP